MGQLDLKQYSFMSLLDATFSLYRRNFGLFFWVTAIFFILPFFAEELINVRLMGPQSFMTGMIEMMGLLLRGHTTPEDIEDLQRWRNLAYYTIPLSMLFFIIVPIAQGAIINAVHQNAVGPGCGFREAFRIGWTKYLNLFLGFLLLNLVFVVIFSLLAIPFALLIGFPSVSLT